jgi:hypothetical protein
LASLSFVRRLQRLRSVGYTIHVVYLSLPTVDFALARVAERVRVGGHDVATIVALVEEGETTDAILALYPDLEAEDVREALLFAAEAVRERTLPLGRRGMKFLVDNALSPALAVLLN